MITKEDVAYFLENFKMKLSTYQIIFSGRKKNRDTILDLEIVPNYRVTIIKSLSEIDYSEGPIVDYDGGPNLWVFGTQVKGREVYVKITMGQFNESTICISFHLAEYPMKYPFK